ncbi:hypothetical protein, partial [Mycobacteroides abscessus]|uniref:hypothetical protein n=1 Tax=Mycobacteroides abscessus TaxID=36809 RepID=UPI002105B9F5
TGGANIRDDKPPTRQPDHHTQAGPTFMKNNHETGAKIDDHTHALDGKFRRHRAAYSSGAVIASHVSLPFVLNSL